MIPSETKSIKPISQTTSWFLKPFQSRYFILAIVFVLGAIGYWLAPPNIPQGSYEAQINVTVNGQAMAITFPFNIASQSDTLKQYTEKEGDYQLIVESKQSFRYQLGEKISYRVKVVDNAGEPIPLSLQDVSSTLLGPNYKQVLLPTQQVGDWLVFNMRIPYQAKVVTGLLFAVVVLWLTELIPLAASALLIPLVIVIAGVTDPQTVLAPFFHPIIILFLAGFLMAQGMHRTGVDRLIALTILRRASPKPAYLMLTMICVTAFFSMWMSNTASVAIIIPIALTVLDKMPEQANKTGFRRALILGVAYAGTIGGVGSAIGTPANMLAITFLGTFTGTTMTFIDWFIYGLPIVIIMLPIIWLYLLLVFRVKLSDVAPMETQNIYKKELQDLGPMSKEQKLILFIFIGIVGLWLTEGWHHVPTAIVALGGALILFFLETIEKEDLNQINWNALITFGGGLSIGSLMVTTGVSDWIALQLTGLAYYPPMLVIFLIAGLTLLIGAFISNTACAAMLIPMAIPLAQILQIDPRLLVAIVAIGSSIDFAMVVGTPPTMIAYSTGYFKTSEIFKRGLGLDFIGVLVLSFGVIWVWYLLGGVTF